MRKNTKKKTGSIIVIASFIFILSVTGLLKLVWPEQRISEAEARTLATMPSISGESLRDGSFPLAVEAYFTDQFPLRNTLIRFSDSMRNMLRITIGDDVQIIQGNQDMGQGDSNVILDELPGDEPMGVGYTSPYVN
ncbi:MAG TPA: hypothetical protein GXZ64_00875 [Clostridiaceae bacterium]|jgi:hypothetical protein|nr:hypothetical protein [Clostridiaceae bacterium]